jgi:hypothetical protein
MTPTQNSTSPKQHKSWAQKFRDWMWKQLKFEEKLQEEKLQIEEKIRSELKPIKEKLEDLKTSESKELTWKDRLQEYSLRELGQYNKRTNDNKKIIHDPTTSAEEKARREAENKSIDEFIGAVERMKQGYQVHPQDNSLSDEKIPGIAERAIAGNKPNTNNPNC